MWQIIGPSLLQFVLYKILGGKKTQNLNLQSCVEYMTGLMGKNGVGADHSYLTEAVRILSEKE